MGEVSKLKSKGHLALRNDNYEDAVKLYTKAASLDSNDYSIFCCRSIAHIKCATYELALQDAEKAIALKPNWPKGYLCKATALLHLRKYLDAIKVYTEGLHAYSTAAQVDPQQEDPEEAQLLDKINPFNAPDLFKKLSEDPRTKGYMEDPEYVELIRQIQANPFTISEKSQDSRVFTTFCVMFGGDKQEAVNEKLLGNEAYKKKSFEEALLHYNRAVALDPTEIIYLLNIAAVYFEQKEYHKCIAQCEAAIEIGRVNRADFKLIGKAFTRIGHAYKKMENWHQAKVYYEKSMSEHRTPEIKTLLSEVEKVIKEAERKAYIDPVKAEEEKELGNQKYKDGDYPAAIKHYTEAIKRNPDDPKYYSNRAACYTKLAAFDLGLKDCDKCVEVDPKFIKGWIRKGKILQGMQQQGKALTAYQRALELDPSNSEALEGYRSCAVLFSSNPEEVRKRAMADPEIQRILRDPTMRLILEQMQSDPRALQDHLKNPEIAAKLQKLLESGLIAIH